MRQKSKQIGLIAEDKSDVLVFEALTAKLIRKNLFSVTSFVGNGCGKLRRKCGAWAGNLLTKGCEIIVIIHDLDRNKEVDLRHKINRQLDAVPQERRLVLIPIEEIEAWLLADPKAIQDVFDIKKTPKIYTKTQTISSPKEFLQRLVTKNSRTKSYVNKTHNGRLASAVSIDLVHQRCPSFRPYPEFLRSAFPNKESWISSLASKP